MKKIIAGWVFQKKEFTAVLEVKLSQIDTKMAKPKVSIFQSFYTFFVEVSTDFVDCNALKSRKEKGWLSSGLL